MIDNKSFCNNPFYFELGYKDSNLEMLESESSALPFGDSPSYYKFVTFRTCCSSATNDIITHVKVFCK